MRTRRAAAPAPAATDAQQVDQLADILDEGSDMDVFAQGSGGGISTWGEAGAAVQGALRVGAIGARDFQRHGGAARQRPTPLWP